MTPPETLSKKAWVASLAIVLLVGLLGLASGTARAAAGSPALVIVSPTEGAVIGNGTPVAVQLLVTNFTLVQPGRVGQVPTAGEGHANVTLDGRLLRLVTDLVPFTLSVPSGSHTLSVQLVSDDGVPLSPDVSASVAFSATSGPATGTPTLAVVSPIPLETTGHGFWLTMLVSNFTLVDPIGQPNAPNEGHIRIFVQGAVVEELSTADPVILVSMPDGDIALTVSLVNNDNSLLSPDVTVTVPIHVTASSAVTLPLILHGGSTLLLGFTLVVLILRRRRIEKTAAQRPRENGPTQGGGRP